MNDTVNIFLLTGHNFMPEMHLIQPEFTYSLCGPFTKNKERIKKQEIHIIYIGVIKMKVVYSTIWFMIAKKI